MLLSIIFDLKPLPYLCERECVLSGQGGVATPSGQDATAFQFGAIAVRNYETMLEVLDALVLVSVSGCHCVATPCAISSELLPLAGWLDGLPVPGLWVLCACGKLEINISCILRQQQKKLLRLLIDRNNPHNHTHTHIYSGRMNAIGNLEHNRRTTLQHSTTFWLKFYLLLRFQIQYIYFLWAHAHREAENRALSTENYSSNKAHKSESFSVLFDYFYFCVAPAACQHSKGVGCQPVQDSSSPWPLSPPLPLAIRLPLACEIKCITSIIIFYLVRWPFVAASDDDPIRCPFPSQSKKCIGYKYKH